MKLLIWPLYRAAIAFAQPQKPVMYVVLGAYVWLAVRLGIF